MDDAALISIDSKGVDIRVRIGAQVNSTESLANKTAKMFFISQVTDFLLNFCLLFPSQYNVQRLSFELDHKVESLEQASEALQDLIDNGFVGPTGF